MRRTTEAIIIHTTATGWQKPETVDSIREMHVKIRGFRDIGYHYLIGLEGEKWVGRKPINSVGAHVGGFNNRTLGVSYVGGLGPDGKPKDTRTPKQTAALITVLKPLLRLYRNAVVLGHRDLSPDLDHDGLIEWNEYIKQCPCFNAGPWAVSAGLPGGYYDQKTDTFRKIKE